MTGIAAAQLIAGTAVRLSVGLASERVGAFVNA